MSSAFGGQDDPGEREGNRSVMLGRDQSCFGPSAQRDWSPFARISSGPSVISPSILVNKYVWMGDYVLILCNYVRWDARTILRLKKDKTRHGWRTAGGGKFGRPQISLDRAARATGKPADGL